jgi:murein DD-endopeptidase MepM/ murein hydrolase activator NlpD
MTFVASYVGWVWPMELHPADYRKPVISDGFGTAASGKRGGAGHYGIDLMYRRPIPGTPSLPDRTKAFEVPSDLIHALACYECTVGEVNRLDSHGISVGLDHHNVAGVGPRWSVYRHLSQCELTKGQTLHAGDIVGIVGYDRTKRANETPNHLHFELWDTSRPRVDGNPRHDFGFDPAPFMGSWSYKGRTGKLESGTGVPPAAGQEDAGESDASGPNLYLMGGGLYAAKVLLIG